MLELMRLELTTLDWSRLRGLFVLVALVGCDRAPSPPAAKVNTPANSPTTKIEKKAIPASGDLFTDVTESLGFKLPDKPWPDGQYQTPEITPGGVAIFDYDGDGRQDIYQVCHCPAGSFTRPAPNRLFQQRPDGTFQEVPNAAGLNDPGFGHGVAIGDVDNDGDLDVFVSNYGPDKLFANDGGKFVDRTKAAGISDDDWSSSAGFLDYDRDGFLDLWVVTFAIFDPSKKCQSSDAENDRDYCGPHVFQGVADRLYHNNGDGTFTDVSEKAGIQQPARGWGLVCADLTDDGWCDVYIANDEEPAQLWVNQQDGTFVDEAVIRGCAFNAAGRVEAGMGVAIGDLDNDGTFDLFKTHIASETNTLYLMQDGAGNYADKTAAAGMGAVDRPYTGWGTGFFDYDHDGLLDVAVANGRVAKGTVHPHAECGPFWNRFAEPKLLFHNDGGGRLTDVGSHAGSFSSLPQVSRGLAFADLDGDGDIDMVAQNLDNSLRIYRNDAPKQDNHWLLVKCQTGKRDAYGAIVRLTAGDSKLVRYAHPTYSYLSSNDPRAHFGLGAATDVKSLQVTWPSGKREVFEVPGIDREITIVEGEGQSVP